ISGAGTVTLPNDNFYTGTTTFNGATALNTGTLVLGAVSSLGNGTLAITNSIIGTSVTSLTGATGFPLTVANAITLNNSGVTLGTATASTNLTFTGPVSLTGNNQVTTSGIASTAVTLGGVVSGSGSLNVIGGAGQLILPNVNTYSGGTNLGGGTVLATTSST